MGIIIIGVSKVGLVIMVLDFLMIQERFFLRVYDGDIIYVAKMIVPIALSRQLRVPLRFL